MTTENGTIDEIELEDDAGVDEQDGGDSQATEDGEESTEQLTISIGEETADDDLPDDAENLVGKLRDLAKARAKELKERERENRELRERVESMQPVEKAPELAAKPTMESVDHDTERFATETDAWYAQKAKVDEFQAAAKSKQTQQQDAWNARLEGYKAEKEKLRTSIPDIDDAENEVKAKLSTVQQAILVKAKKNAMLVAALGKSPAKLKALADIKDPVDFAIAIGEIGEQIKVTKKSTTPPPEQTGARGIRAVTSGGKNGRSAKEQQLLDQAAKTGNTGPYIAYKREMRRVARG